MDILYRNQKTLGITCRDPEDIPGCFGELIRNSSEKYGLRAVVLSATSLTRFSKTKPSSASIRP
ncbi:MAG: hypothetical protein LC657_04380 [Desulfobacteraceae bacterium]|nr:hypothetical protein [Desulfobacteraceae bacterium]